jgi:hypothetical protein
MDNSGHRRGSTFGLGLLLAVGTIFLAGTAVAPQGAEAATSRETLAKYRAWMEDARKLYPYPQSVDKMYRVMMCESSGNARAVGYRSLYHGLFQYARGTWNGKWNPYRSQNIYDAKAQIYATAKAWSIKMQSHWGCYYKTAGR